MASRRLVLAAAWIACLALAALWVSSRVEVRSDLTLFMPRADSDAARLLLAELREGPASRVMLVALDGEPESALAEASNALAARLRATGLFTRVANGNQPLNARERERLFAYRYLLSPQVGAATFTEQGLRAALERRLGELTATLPAADKALLPRDPTGEFRAMLRSWRSAREPALRHGVWFADGESRALLVAQTRAPGFDPEAQTRAVAAVRESARDVAPAATLTLSGPGVFSVDARDRIRAQVRILGIAAGALVAFIVLLGYRSPLLLALGALPLATGVLAAIVAVALVFDGIHGIALAFGVTVLGVAIDYPVHVFSHLSAARTVAASLSRIWPTLRLSVLTTAIGYLAMTGSGFPGLAQLAVFAIVGLLAAAAATRFGLPALLPERWQPRHGAGLSARLARRAAPARAWLAVPIGAGVLAVLYLMQRGPDVWQDDLAALSPLSSQVVARDRALRAELAAPAVRHLAVIRTGDAQAALERSEALAADLPALIADGTIGGFDLAARYVPSVATQLARRAALPARATLEAALGKAIRGLPFRPDAFSGFVDDVVSARAEPPLLADELAESAPGLRASPLLFRADGGWLALVTFSEVAKPQSLARWLHERGGEGVTYLDAKSATEALLADFRAHALVRIAWGGLLITAVLWVGLRSIARVALVLAPGLLAIAADVALLALSGVRLTLFHLVALLLVLGIGIDYALFFNRDDGDPDERAGTLHGLVVCAVSTCGVFAVLSLSDLPVLDALGNTVALGVALSFAAASVIAQQTRRRAR